MCLDHNDLNNYRPVSNLCFIANILEILVLSQVTAYLNSHNRYNTCQLAYRSGHFSQCILSLCLPLLTDTLSYIIHLLITYKYRCLLPKIEYLSYFTLYSHVYVMSKLGQLRTCLNLMTTRQNSCLSPLKELSISITYLL